MYARRVYAKNRRPLRGVLYTLLSSTRGLSPFSAGPQAVNNVSTYDTVYTVPIVDYRIIWRRHVRDTTGALRAYRGLRVCETLWPAVQTGDWTRNGRRGIYDGGDLPIYPWTAS